MIFIGTCGYSDYKPGQGCKDHYKSKIQAYADAYSAVEINKTFYKPRMRKTAARWREEAGDELVIAMKAGESELDIVWEHRGDYLAHPDVLKSIFQETGAVHATDILRRRPISRAGSAYVRLHGLNEREFDYRYIYSRNELERLADELEWADEQYDSVLCLFNNESMYDNADTLKEILAAG